MSPFAAAEVTSERLKVSVPSGFKCQEEMAETNQSFGVEKRKRDNFFSVDFSTFREMQFNLRGYMVDSANERVREGTSTINHLGR